MVESCQLRVDRSLVGTAVTSRALSQLLSDNVLVEWQPSPIDTPRREVIAFAHNVLFGYAVERLLLRGLDEPMVKVLTAQPDWAVVIHPSLMPLFL